jgi:hypothetical protein
MNTLLVCLIPLLYSAILIFIGWYIGRNGSPIKWIGFKRRDSAGGTRVAKEFD